MARLLPILLAAAALAACGADPAGVTCAELERSPQRQAEMTEAVAERAGVDRELARSTWEAYCSNSVDPETDRPFRESVRVLG